MSAREKGWQRSTMTSRNSSLAAGDAALATLAAGAPADGSIDRQTATALLAAASVGFGTNLAIQLVNLGLHSRGVSAGLIGVSTMAQAVGIVLAAPLAPRAMWSFGARQTMIFGAALAAVAMTGMAHTADFYAVTALRVFYAAGLAFVFTCSEYIVLARTAEQTRGRRAGLYASVLGIGMALGPAWITLVGSSGPEAYYSGAFLCLACIPATARCLAGVTSPPPSWQGHGISLFIRLAPLGFFSAFLFGFIDNGPVSLLAVSGVQKGWSDASSALLVSVVTLGSIVFQLPVGWAIDRFKPWRVFLTGALAAIVLLMTLPHVWATTALVILYVIGLGVVMEGLYTVGLADVGRRVPAAHLSAANAYLVAVCGAGEILGPLVTGIALDCLG
jgi:MFS family permease